jgi:hypothetical protein
MPCNEAVIEHVHKFFSNDMLWMLISKITDEELFAKVINNELKDMNLADQTGLAIGEGLPKHHGTVVLQRTIAHTVMELALALV